MGFNEAVIHDLVILENDMINAKKELKKLKKVNAVQWVLIGYLLYKVNEKSSENDSVVDKIDEKVHEKCEKIFKKKR